MWCGASLKDVALPSQDIACPDCAGARLEERREGDLILHLCPDCAGVWMGGGMIAKLEKIYEHIGEAGGAADPQAHQEKLRQGIVDKGLNAGYRSCPICGLMMARRRYRKISNVIIDECIGHGLWFDADELEQVVQFLESGGLRRARQFADAERAQFGSSMTGAIQDAQALGKMLGRSIWRF